MRGGTEIRSCLAAHLSCSTPLSRSLSPVQGGRSSFLTSCPLSFSPQVYSIPTLAFQLWCLFSQHIFDFSNEMIGFLNVSPHYPRPHTHSGIGLENLFQLPEAENRILCPCLSASFPLKHWTSQSPQAEAARRSRSKKHLTASPQPLQDPAVGQGSHTEAQHMLWLTHK